MTCELRLACFAFLVALLASSAGANGKTYVFSGEQHSLGMEGVRGRDISSEERIVILDNIRKNICSVDDSKARSMVEVMDYLSMCDDTAMSVYTSILSSEPRSVSLKWTVAKMLGRFGESARKVLPTLAEAVRKPKFGVEDWRDAAATAIGDIGPPVSEDTVSALVTGAQLGLQFGSTCTSACIASLEKLGAQGHTGLLKLLAVEDSRVSERALAALLKSEGTRKSAINGMIDSLPEPRRTEYKKLLSRCLRENTVNNGKSGGESGDDSPKGN